MKKLFAWDFHGTLEKGTEVGFADILRELARGYKIRREITLGEVRRLFGISVAQYLRHFFPKATEKVLGEMRNKIRDIQAVDHLGQYVTAADGALAVLSQIKAAGHTNIVVSNSSLKHISMMIRVVGMELLIDEVFAMDRHFRTSNVGLARLDLLTRLAEQKAEAILKFAKAHKFTSDRIIVIGDRGPDVDAGILIGATTYQYTRRGFVHDQTEATYKISDLREVLREI